MKTNHHCRLHQSFVDSFLISGGVWMSQPKQNAKTRLNNLTMATNSHSSLAKSMKTQTNWLQFVPLGLILLALIWILAIALSSAVAADVGPLIPNNPQTASAIVTVSNAPVWHNPRAMQWDGYSNCWMELQSCTNLREGNWQTRQIFFFPTSTVADFTNRQEFFKLEVKVRTFKTTNQ